MSAAALTVPKIRGRPPVELRAPDETREQLLSAALSLFVDRGYRGASIKAIAERAGVTSGTIYCHFDNKGELLLEVLQTEVRRTFTLNRSLRERQSEALTIDDLASMVSKYATAGLAKARKLTLELHSAAATEHALSELHLAWNKACQDDLGEFLESAKAYGMIAEEIDVPYTADLLLTLILGLAHLETLDPALVDDAPWIAYLESVVRKVLGSAS